MNKKKKKVLITGITGFAGSHLAELLLKNNYQVYGTTRPRSSKDNIVQIKDRLKLSDADIVDSHSLNNLVSKIKPDYIFHLAAQSFVPTSWASPATTFEVNVIGTVNLFEAVRRARINPKIQIACSSEEYGLVHQSELPVKETNPLRPLSPYAVSKVAMDYLGYQYFRSYEMQIVRTRGFNHTGPRRGDVFATSNFSKQIAEIEKGLKEAVIHVGNLEAKRDFTDARDMVRGYLLAILKCQAGEVYNICSGKAVRIRKILDILLSLSKVKIKIKKDKERIRPSDVPILLGDCSKFQKETGWKPQLPLEKTLKDLLDYWRERV